MPLNSHLLHGRLDSCLDLLSTAPHHPRKNRMHSTRFEGAHTEPCPLSHVWKGGGMDGWGAPWLLCEDDRRGGHGEHREDSLTSWGGGLRGMPFWETMLPSCNSRTTPGGGRTWAMAAGWFSKILLPAEFKAFSLHIYILTDSCHVNIKMSCIWGITKRLAPRFVSVIQHVC